MDTVNVDTTNLQAEQVRAARRTSTATRVRVGRLVLLVVDYLGLTAGAALMVVPFIWMLSTSLKTMPQVFVFPPQWIPNPVEWSNYARAIDSVSLRVVSNSVFVTTTITVGLLLFTTMSGFAFARLQLPGKDVLFLCFIATMMVPANITLIPMFITVNWFGWVDTYQGIILPNLGHGVAGVFLFRQFFSGIPRDLYDQAVIDGCNPWRSFAIVHLPLAGPAIAAFGTITALNAWTMYLWPLVVTNSTELRVITVAIAFLGRSTESNVLMAAVVVSTLPMLMIYLVAQRWFVAGIAGTGLKG